ncbi:hypothetical protein F503_00854 [Ophiostoma piceae UAMH 11346]|uniref:Uncharacterized protein n=1 Tax=Ophiostoma piceae (strain UAMH 11346) TaxID=1262450 RepID=S3C805_OPHP1|nr:hypothetical protein F503_00854 [Ophiostoma piceae UAMH 11346]
MLCSSMDLAVQRNTAGRIVIVDIFIIDIIIEHKYRARYLDQPDTGRGGSTKAVQRHTTGNRMAWHGKAQHRMAKGGKKAEEKGGNRGSIDAASGRYQGGREQQKIAATQQHTATHRNSPCEIFICVGCLLWVRIHPLPRYLPASSSTWTALIRSPQRWPLCCWRDLCCEIPCHISQRAHARLFRINTDGSPCIARHWGIARQQHNRGRALWKSLCKVSKDMQSLLAADTGDVAWARPIVSCESRYGTQECRRINSVE